MSTASTQTPKVKLGNAGHATTRDDIWNKTRVARVLRVAVYVVATAALCQVARDVPFRFSLLRCRTRRGAGSRGPLLRVTHARRHRHDHLVGAPYLLHAASGLRLLTPGPIRWAASDLRATGILRPLHRQRWFGQKAGSGNAGPAFCVRGSASLGLEP